MNQNNIAILDDYQNIALKMADWSSLQEKAHIVTFQDHVSDPKEVIERLKPFNIVCVMRERTPLSRSILEKLPRLKLITSTAFRNASIDLKAAHELGITVCYTGYVPHGVVELTWALIFAVARNIYDEVHSIKNGGWQTTIGSDLKGKTLGIVGLGFTGSAVAHIAKAFGMQVIAWSQNLTEEKTQGLAQYVSKKELFQESDIVTLHLVSSERTKNIVDTQEFAWMKKCAYLINTSRGPLVNETALIKALQNKQIAKAALDVYNIEPLPQQHPFRSMQNIVITPHIGFVTEETYKIFYRDSVENIHAWLNKRPIRIMRLQ